MFDGIERLVGQHLAGDTPLHKNNVGLSNTVDLVKPCLIHPLLGVTKHGCKIEKIKVRLGFNNRYISHRANFDNPL